MLTLPAACLEALGGLAESDAPVLVRSGQGTCVAIMPDHPMGENHAPPWCADERLLLPQSAPALLQVLARHVGKGGPLLMVRDPESDAGWGWLALDDEGCFFDSGDFDCPTLTPSMSRMRALAEVVVWLARVERVDALTSSLGDWQEPHVREIEQRLSLPTWSVSDD